MKYSKLLHSEYWQGKSSWILIRRKEDLQEHTEELNNDLKDVQRMRRVECSTLEESEDPKWCTFFPLSKESHSNHLTKFIIIYHHPYPLEDSKYPILKIFKASWFICDALQRFMRCSAQTTPMPINERKYQMGIRFRFVLHWRQREPFPLIWDKGCPLFYSLEEDS